MKTHLRIAALCCAALVLLPGAAAAQQAAGVRAGLSVDPDQFYFGGHFETEEFIDQLHLRPNLELGVGDDVTTVALNIEVVYKIPLRTRRGTNFYFGGGPAINFYDFDNRSDTRGGLNLLAGLEFDNGLLFEVKGGLFDSPDLKVGIGYTFR